MWVSSILELTAVHEESNRRGKKRNSKGRQTGHLEIKRKRKQAVSEVSLRLSSYQETTGGQRLHLDKALNMRPVFGKTPDKDYQNTHLFLFFLSLSSFYFLFPILTYQSCKLLLHPSLGVWVYVCECMCLSEHTGHAYVYMCIMHA